MRSFAPAVAIRCLLHDAYLWAVFSGGEGGRDCAVRRNEVTIAVGSIGMVWRSGQSGSVPTHFMASFAACATRAGEALARFSCPPFQSSRLLVAPCGVTRQPPPWKANQMSRLWGAGTGTRWNPAGSCLGMVRWGIGLLQSGPSGEPRSPHPRIPPSDGLRRRILTDWWAIVQRGGQI